MKTIFSPSIRLLQPRKALSTEIMILLNRIQFNQEVRKLGREMGSSEAPKKYFNMLGFEPTTSGLDHPQPYKHIYKHTSTYRCLNRDFLLLLLVEVQCVLPEFHTCHRKTLSTKNNRVQDEKGRKQRNSHSILTPR